MKFIINGRQIQIENLTPQLDEAFIALHEAYFGHRALDLGKFNNIALDFFNSDRSSPVSQDSYFTNFIVIWRSYLSTSNFDEAENIWKVALEPALSWEATNPSKYIHKGTPYYCWGSTSILRGDLDKGYTLMHQGFKEDVRSSEKSLPDTPAFAFVSLNYSKAEQAFRGWVLMQKEFLSRFVDRYSSIATRNFTLEDFSNRFLKSPPRTELVFLFAYTVARLMKFSSLPQHTRASEFAGQIEENLLFDIVLVIDGAIKSKNTTKCKFIDHAECLSKITGQPISNQHLVEINAAYKSNFNNTLNHMLNNSFTLSDGTKLFGTQFDIAIAYGLRNHGAHEVSSVPTMWLRFDEILQSLMNVLFMTIDYLY